MKGQAFGSALDTQSAEEAGQVDGVNVTPLKLKLPLSSERMPVISSPSLMNFTVSLRQQLESLPTLAVI